jgi:hypothetical protein
MAIMRHVLAVVIFGLLSCATTPGDADLRSLQPVREVATGCGVMMAEGAPVAMDFVHPGSRTSAQAIGALIAGRHVFENVWLPWWSAEPVAANPLGALTIEITPSAAYDAGPMLQLGVELRVSDASGAVVVERHARFNVPSRDEALLSLDFEDPALAKRLGLPPAEEPGHSADPFQLSVSWWRAKLRAELYSSRAGNSCPLSQAKPELEVCERGAGRLVMHEDAVTEPRDLKAKLAQDFAPIDALTELQREPLEIAWPHGTVSRLHVSYEPDGHACVTEGDVYVHLTEYDPRRAPGYKVYIPLHATLRSEDGRLNVRLRGFAETLIAHDWPWDRHVDSALGFRELARLSENERPGFDVQQRELAFVSGWLRTPMSESEVPGLSLTICEPYPGVPAYPPVDETWSNRFGCFCARTPGQEARIRPYGSGSP